MRRLLLHATGAAVAALLVVFFLLPLAGAVSPPGAEGEKPVEKSRKNRFPKPEGWVAEDQAKALTKALEQKKLVKDVEAEDPAKRRQRLHEEGFSIKDMTAQYLVLNSPDVNTYDGKYGPVRFMHGKHASALNNNCASCHHYRPKDRALPELMACRSCHQEAFNPDMPERVGLKAAYHQQCMGCHETMKKGPVHCRGCHAKEAPDHKDLVKLPKDPSPMEVTKECLRCHEKAGEEMLTTAHWLWRGPSPYTVGHRKEVMSGKGTDTINNFCIALPSNWPRCTSCHAGYGWKDATFDFSDKSRIDCLVCHDTTGSYAKVPTKAGMPDPSVDLVYVAQNVGASSRTTCGVCHFAGGGGDAVKHADMCGKLRYGDRNCDVHMGGYDFSCVECHKTQNHEISGRSSSAPVVETSRSCEDCHTNAPHHKETILGPHLNKHCESVSCNTCHTPIYAKCKPTKTWWDWSLAGDKKREVRKENPEMPDYDWMKGEFRWKESAKPEYAWHNGYIERLYIGDKVSLEGAVVDPSWSFEQKFNGDYIHISSPLGSIKDPNAKIAPFKIMRGIQPVDLKNKYLATPHLFPTSKEDATAYWKNLEWSKAIVDGMKVAGLEYSGEYGWARTDMHWRIEHEVMPKEMALSCVQCHDALKGERTCDRCHKDSRDVKFKELAHKGTDFSYLAKRGRDVSDLVGVTDYIDFKKLGYPGDPILTGGRFTKLPLGARDMGAK
jgi:octaheme c-type cytochrome (tetrathionate reductase family)